ncbi:hypothetical protein LLG95_12190 [bacterium]|nr:hypothetical protein [bacterium]
MNLNEAEIEKILRQTPNPEVAPELYKRLASDLPPADSPEERSHRVRFTKPAMALTAIMMLLAMCWVLEVVNPAGSNYAFAQTVEANRSVRFVHLKIDNPGFPSGEAWAQLNAAGEIEVYRRIFRGATPDQDRDTIWRKDKAEVWFKARKKAQIMSDEYALGMFLNAFRILEARTCVQELNNLQAAGKARIKAHVPNVQGDPIILEVTQSDGNLGYQLYFVDPETNLLKSQEWYAIKHGQSELMQRVEYLDYNPPADSGLFAFNYPADVKFHPYDRIIGIEQVNMTESETAKEIVRQLFDAFIVHDWNKIGQLQCGIPAELIEQNYRLYGALNVTRIVSISDPSPAGPQYEKGSMLVSAKIEYIGEDKRPHIWDCKDICVVSLGSKPQRWFVQNELSPPWIESE